MGVAGDPAAALFELAASIAAGSAVFGVASLIAVDTAIAWVGGRLVHADDPSRVLLGCQSATVG